MLRGKKILAIDDTLSIRTFLRISLESQGSKFYEANNGKEGLALSYKIKPDLVVLDLGLPDLDGLDILPKIKNPPKVKFGSAVPRVIVLTVRKENETKDRARQLGADAYITKPFLVDELIEAIETTMLGRIYRN
jgi:DNA-binding response OmpR family regulator